MFYEQITGKGKYKVLLNKAQNDKLNESKKLKTGIILELSYEQIKTGGFLPLLLPILAALGGVGGLAGGAAAIANAVKTSQHQNAEEEETKRHNLEMEKIAKTKQGGSGLKKKGEI